MSRRYKPPKVRSAVNSVLGSAIMVPLLFSAMPAAAAQNNAVEQLRNQIEQLEARLDKLENKQKSDEGLKIGDTEVDIGGYVKLDAFYDMEGDQGTTLLPSDVNVNGASDDEPHLGWTAKQTRLKISTTTSTPAGKINGYIEADMYGSGFDSSSDGGQLRLRLAYLTYGNWLIGRNWTTFSNFNYGTMLNFAGPAGQVFERTEQIRYTFDLANQSKFAVALEDAGTVDVTRASETSSSLPQLALRYQSTMGMLAFQTAGVVRSIEAENASGAEESTLGWGLNLGGTLSLTNRTSLMLTGAYGEGIGDLIYTANFGPAAYFDGDSLETNDRYGVIGTISQKWTDQVTTNLIYGYSVWQSGATTKEVTGTTLAANVLYSPVKALRFGLEYDRVTKEIQTNSSSNDGDANRIQFSTSYYF